MTCCLIDETLLRVKLRKRVISPLRDLGSPTPIRNRLAITRIMRSMSCGDSSYSSLVRTYFRFNIDCNFICRFKYRSPNASISSANFLPLARLLNFFLAIYLLFFLIYFNEEYLISLMSINDMVALSFVYSR